MTRLRKSVALCVARIRLAHPRRLIATCRSLKSSRASVRPTMRLIRTRSISRRDTGCTTPLGTRLDHLYERPFDPFVVAYLALPDHSYSKTHCIECLQRRGITFHVAFELAAPKVDILLGCRRARAARMSVPVT